MSDYFKESSFFQNYLQTKTSREILEENARYFYVSNPKDAETDEQKTDPLYKIRFLVDYIEKKFKQFWQPYPNLTVDEAMVPTKSKLSGFRMFMKDKPIKWGYKLWEIADEMNYVYSFKVYTGKKGNKGKSEAGLGKRILREMVGKLPENRPWRIYADNFFTDVETVENFQKENIYFTGEKKEEKEKKKRRGVVCTGINKKKKKEREKK